MAADLLPSLWLFAIYISDTIAAASQHRDVLERIPPDGNDIDALVISVVTRGSALDSPRNLRADTS